MFWYFRPVSFLIVVTASLFARGTIALAMEGTPPKAEDVTAKSIVFIDVEKGENCSGVVFRKNEIITAAHCVVGDGNQTVSPKRVKVYYTRNFAENHETFRNVTAIIVNPHFQLGEKNGNVRVATPGSVDVAILKLSDAHPPDAIDALLVKNANDGKYSWGSRWIQSRAAAYGFGKTHRGDMFVLRTGEMIVDSKSSKLQITDGRPVLTGISIRKGKKTALCYGDSGGGIFVKTRITRRQIFKNGKPLLAGIVMSTPSKEQCSNESRMISVRVFYNWIAATH